MTTAVRLSLTECAKRLISDPALKQAVLVFVVLRLVISVWAALVLAITHAPTSPDDVLRPYQGIEQISGGPAELFLGVWQRFDTLWYLRIALHGYSAAVSDIHFPPLYPLLIKVLGTILLGNYLLAAIIISNIACILGLTYLYKLTAELFNVKTARRTVLYLSIFPTAFFLLAPYSESLLVLLAVATFYYMATTQAWMRGLFGVTKPVELWWDIQPISAGLFGVPVGIAVIILVSLVTPAPSKKVQELVDHVRYPQLKGDINTQAT